MMNADDKFNALTVTGITVTWNVENIWQLSFDGVSSSAFLLADHIFHLYMRRYELSIAIYLCRDDAVPVVMPLLCKLCMVDHIGQQKLIGEREIVTAKEKEFVLIDSIMVDDLEGQKAEFLSKDTLTISCNLSSSYRVNLLKQKDAEAPKIINRFETLSSDLESFFETQKDTDAVLKVENTEFPVHRAILCARCPELASKLNETPNNLLDISDIPVPIMKDVLHYIYTGKIRAVTSENAVQMLAASNRFSLIELKQVCLQFFRSTLTEDSVFDTAVLAHEYEDMVLKEEVEQYLVKHLTTILQTEKWKEFCSERYKFANEIMSAVLLRMQTSTTEKGDC